MNRAILVHYGWLFVAVLAFAAGFHLFPAGRGGGDGRPDGAKTTLGGGGGSEPELLAGLEAEEEEGDDALAQAADLSESAPPTDGEIRKLGEAFRASTSPIDRRLAFSALLEGLTAENALLVREQIAHKEPRSAEFREFHYAWGAVAGAEAAMFGAGTEEDDMAPALAGWANADPQAALAWFKGLDMENDPGFDPLLKDRKIPVDQMRGHLMRGLVEGLASADPGAASDFVLSMVEDGQKGAEHLMHRVAEQMMRTNAPSQTAAWAENLPSGEARNIAMRRALESWARRDPKAASEYLLSMPDSAVKDSAISGFTGRLAWEDPVSAITWAQTIASEGHRMEAIFGVGRAWAHKDAAAAAEWAASSGLPEEMQQKMLNVRRDRDRD